MFRVSSFSIYSILARLCTYILLTLVNFVNILTYSAVTTFDNHNRLSSFQCVTRNTHTHRRDGTLTQQGSFSRMEWKLYPYSHQQPQCLCVCVFVFENVWLAVIPSCFPPPPNRSTDCARKFSAENYVLYYNSISWQTICSLYVCVNVSLRNAFATCTQLYLASANHQCVFSIYVIIVLFFFSFFFFFIIFLSPIKGTDNANILSVRANIAALCVFVFDFVCCNSILQHTHTHHIHELRRGARVKQ